MRWRAFFAGWMRPSRREEAHRAETMTWTCPAGRAPQETVIDSNAEAGGIVTVSCACCAAQHRVSVFFRPPPSGIARIAFGVVWL